MQETNLQYKKEKNTQWVFKKVLKYSVFVSLFLSIITILRVFIVLDISQLYLNWNLFLAFLPLVFLYIAFYKVQSNIFKYVLFFLVFLFLPNAPYVITDSFHIVPWSKVVWLDTLIFFSFAFVALWFYIFTILFFIKKQQKWFSPKKEIFFLSIISFLNSFGIYLGRELRFNSWDIVHNPASLFFRIFDIILYPFGYEHFLNIIIFWTLFLFCVVWIFKQVLKQINIFFNKK